MCPENADRELLFRAAWGNDVAAMRDLLARNPSYAGTTECLPPRTPVGVWVDRQIGAGPTAILHVAARQGHTEIAKLLLSHHAPVDPRDPLGGTPLHLAAQYGHDEVAALLLDAGATLEARRNGGLTPLAVAASHGRYPVVKRLLAAGADVNSRATFGWTPLHGAASEGRLNVVSLLLAYGADPHARTDSDSTPADLARTGHYDDVLRLLTSRL